MLPYLPNLLSLCRIPLAFLFLVDNDVFRCLVIVLAGLTDLFDGMLARRFGTSRLGTLLDPIGDKFFVLFVFGTLFYEGELSLPLALAMLSRDWAIALFGAYLFLRGQWAGYKIRAFWCGKIATTLQFIVLVALALQQPVPKATATIFVILGVLSLLELYSLSKQRVIPAKIETSPES